MLKFLLGDKVMIKSGFVSTEFWAMTLIAIATFWAGILQYIPQPWATIVPAVAVSFYGAFRTAVKIAHLVGQWKNVAELPDLPLQIHPGVKQP